MDDIDEDDEVIIFLDEIIRYRMIPRRTNWRYRYLALNQQEVAAVSTIQLSISELTDFFLVLVLLVNQLLTVLHSSTRRNADQNVPLRQQMALHLCHPYGSMTSIRYMQFYRIFEGTSVYSILYMPIDSVASLGKIWN